MYLSSSSQFSSRLLHVPSISPKNLTPEYCHRDDTVKPCKVVDLLPSWKQQWPEWNCTSQHYPGIMQSLLQKTMQGCFKSAMIDINIVYGLLIQATRHSLCVHKISAQKYNTWNTCNFCIKFCSNDVIQGYVMLHDFNRVIIFTMAASQQLHEVLHLQWLYFLVIAKKTTYMYTKKYRKAENNK